MRLGTTNSFSMQQCFDTSLLSTAYFPPIAYFAAIANSSQVIIEAEEMYQKQSYRTRCHIPSGNGLLVLTIPAMRVDGVHKSPLKEVRIDYSKPWLIQHKRALEAAYRSSPFFEYYQDDLFAILDKKESYLLDLNTALTRKIMELIGLKDTLRFSETFLTPQEAAQTPSVKDWREKIHPKYKGETLLQEYHIEKPYYQVFTNKQGFISNLSIIDLLCNEGPNSISFLKI